MTRNVPARAAIVLFLLFFLGLAVTLFAFIDLRWTHWVFTTASVLGPGPSKHDAAPVDPNDVQRLRKSILNVRVDQCGSVNEAVGTGFVVKAGYVATAAHVLGNSRSCNGAIRLIDSGGLEHNATIVDVNDADDLAILRLPDMSLPALLLADAALYESPGAMARLVTIGYPLESEGASAPDSAAISGEGSLSRYDHDRNVFVTSGLNLNPGNSGGPIFVRDNWTVLGIARSKLPNAVGDGIGFVASIRAFENFFRHATGEELR